MAVGGRSGARPRIGAGSGPDRGRVGAGTGTVDRTPDTPAVPIFGAKPGHAAHPRNPVGPAGPRAERVQGGGSGKKTGQGHERTGTGPAPNRKAGTDISEPGPWAGRSRAEAGTWNNRDPRRSRASMAGVSAQHAPAAGRAGRDRDRETRACPGRCLCPGPRLCPWAGPAATGPHLSPIAANRPRRAQGGPAGGTDRLASRPATAQARPGTGWRKQPRTAANENDPGKTDQKNRPAKSGRPDRQRSKAPCRKSQS